MLVAPILVAIFLYVGWLGFGHYYFKPPNHVLVGHEVTVYGLSGLIIVLGAYVILWLIVMNPPTISLELAQVFIVPTILIGIGGILTWYMHRHDNDKRSRKRERELEAQVATLEVEIARLKEGHA